MDSYGFKLSIDGKILYYSGDANCIPINILNEFLIRDID
jgi:hypothetical protein